MVWQNPTSLVANLPECTRVKETTGLLSFKPFSLRCQLFLRLQSGRLADGRANRPGGAWFAHLDHVRRDGPKDR